MKFTVKRSDLRSRKLATKPEPKLHLIGYWKEHSKDNYIDPHLLVDPEWENRNDVIRYLKSGTFYEGCFGWSTCRICGQKNGSTELTDGVWYWPQGLVHYIEEHNVILPEEFVEYIMMDNKADFTTTFSWDKWCMQKKEKK